MQFHSRESFFSVLVYPTWRKSHAISFTCPMKATCAKTRGKKTSVHKFPVRIYLVMPPPRDKNHLRKTVGVVVRPVGLFDQSGARQQKMPIHFFCNRRALPDLRAFFFWRSLCAAVVFVGAGCARGAAGRQELQYCSIFSFLCTPCAWEVYG